MNIARFACSLTLAWVVLGSCGCSTLTTEDRSLLTGMKTDIRTLEEQVTRIEGRIQAIEVRQRDLQDQVDGQKATSQAGDSQLAERVKKLDARITTVDNSRIADRQEIVQHLGKKIEEIITEAVPAGGSDLVYEHTVKKGESLSAIAAFYGASVDAIVELNKLDNPNSIRAGQLLYVPK